MKLLKNFAVSLLLTFLMITTAYALAADGTIVGISGGMQINLQGGNNSSVQWRSPSASPYKIWVQVPAGSSATNATYRIYLKGNAANNSVCSSTDVTYPCYEIVVNQAMNQGKWVQLISGSTAQWKLSLGAFVSVNAGNIASTEILGISSVSFENMTPLAIGTKVKGGIVFYVDKTGKHGLVAAPTDILDNSGNLLMATWSNGSYITTRATATAVGTGKANTAAIIVSEGAGIYAAKLCDDLVIGIYSDWYLPSRDELNLMYKNIGQGAVAPLTNIAGFVDILYNAYWSSSESDTGFAWSQNFNDGVQHNYNESYPFSVRAIRSF